MKKILLTLSVLGLLSTLAYADSWVTGKPVKVEKWMNATVYYLHVEGDDADCKVKWKPDAGMDTDSQKLINAMTLTALAAGKEIQVYLLGAGTCTTSENVAPYTAQGIKLVD